MEYDLQRVGLKKICYRNNLQNTGSCGKKKRVRGIKFTDKEKKSYVEEMKTPWKKRKEARKK